MVKLLIDAKAMSYTITILSFLRKQESRGKRTGFRVKHGMTRFVSIFFFLLLLPAAIYAEENPLNLMRDDILSYFNPLKGRIISAEDGKAVADINIKSGARKGMRISVFREGAPFFHPVTKEPLGKMEVTVGRAEIKDAGPDTSTLVMLKGEVKESDRIRISETKVKMLFYSGKNVEWSIADSYYRVLKDSGRFELIDTALETESDADVIAEAKKLNADVALILSARDERGHTALKQRLFWVEDSVMFAEKEERLDIAFMKELKFGEEFFGPKIGAAQQFVDLPFGISLIAAGDIDGDGKAELLMSTGKDVRVYQPGGELNSLYEIKGSTTETHLRLDAMDVKGDGKDEVLLTLIKNDTVVSRIYELVGGKFSILWEGNLFIRRAGNQLLGQEYSRGEGFKGPVFTITWSGGYKKGENIKLPPNTNIYDFAYMEGPDGNRFVLAYDDAGRLNLYDESGARLWRSKEDYGGFLTTFKRTATGGIIDRGEWSVKDRLVIRNREVFVVKRIPIIGMAKGLGYNKSRIESLWWTGVSMEERSIMENISGNIIDYTLTGDKLIVLSKPSYGIKIQNLLRGENPFGNVLYIYTLKGR